MSRLSPFSLATALVLTACVGAPATVETAPPAGAVPPPARVVANPGAGGAAMLPSRTIAANVATEPTLATLVAAIDATGLAATLSGPGPFTVFAPTDAAFARLAPGVVATLMTLDNKATLVRLLTYHVVPGTITSADLIARIAAGGGTARLTTVAGQPLIATMVGSVIALTDVGGNRSYIETADLCQTNGIVHVVNGVMVPMLQ